MLIDSHTHVHFPAYDTDRDAVIKRAIAAGVSMVCVGTQAATSHTSIELAEQYPEHIWATVGFHPNHVDEQWYHDKKEQREAMQEKFDSRVFRALAQHPKVVAIGECGLDYYRIATSDKQRAVQIKEKQKEVFLEQLAIAQELQKPLMIHCRPSKGTDDAYEDLLFLVTNHQLLVSRIVHFYVGSPAVTQRLLAAGFSFTFGGVITFAHDYDEIINMIPLDRILLETDAPYVAPELYRGKRNEPAFIVATAHKLAELKGVAYDEVCIRTSENARRVFKI